MRFITVTFTVLLVTSLTFIGVTAQTRPYDPWADLDDDGDIDIYDIVDIAGRYGTTGTPINKTELLLELLNRVDSNEARLEQTKWIRFYEPNETSHNVPDVWKDAATFVWTPNNPTNNAIVTVCCYFQHRCEGEGEGLICKMMINNETCRSFIFPPSINYTQTRVRVNWAHAESYAYPNCENYTIKFQLQPWYSPTIAYVKGINIIIEVMDGLPPS